ncbi:MAG: RNA-binding S4 domain-containing protein [Candidatus Gastranaerophilales bacterium]|nr:RNA-binding S4 domain-containing protein [Candidatus Gastranaerophilales bacterium]
MRLDKFLKVSRLIKRRTVAKEVSSKARVFVNDNPAKPAKILKVGDKVCIEYFNKSVVVEVMKIPANNVSIQEAKDLYKIIEEVDHSK